MDILGFRIESTGPQTVTLPGVTVAFRLVDSQTQTKTRHDADGARKIDLWAHIANMSNADKRELVELVVRWAIEKKTAEVGEQEAGKV